MKWKKNKNMKSYHGPRPRLSMTTWNSDSGIVIWKMQDHGLSKALSNDHNKENEMASDIGNNNGKTHDNDLTAKPPTFSEPMLVTNLVKNRKKSKLLKDHDMLTSSVKTDTVSPSLVIAEEVVTDDVSTEVVMVVDDSEKTDVESLEVVEDELLHKQSFERTQTEDVQILPENMIYDQNVVVEEISEGSDGNKMRKTRRQRCKKCPSCQTPNCGICPECKDLVQFGGSGKLKRACRLVFY